MADQFTQFLFIINDEIAQAVIPQNEIARVIPRKPTTLVVKNLITFYIWTASTDRSLTQFESRRTAPHRLTSVHPLMANFLEDKRPEKIERAFLVGVQTKAMAEGEGAELLEELTELVENLKLTVVRKELVQLRVATPATLLGSGKTKELIELAKSEGCHVIVFDEALTPAQQRNWEKLSELAVIDRREFLSRSSPTAPKLVKPSFRSRSPAWSIPFPASPGRGAISPANAVRGRHGRRGRNRSSSKTGASSTTASSPSSGSSSTSANNAPPNARSASAFPLHRRHRRLHQRRQILPAQRPHRCLRPRETELSQPSTPRRDSCSSAAIRSCSSPTPSASSAACRTVWSKPSRPLSRRSSSPISSSTFSMSPIPTSSNTTRPLSLCLKELGAVDKPILTVFNKVDAADEAAVDRAHLLVPDALFLSARSGKNLDQLVAACLEQIADALDAVELLVPHTRYDVIAKLHATGHVQFEESRDEGVFIQGRFAPPKPDSSEPTWWNSRGAR